MKGFLDNLDLNVIILDENLNIIFCNNCFLQKVKIDKKEINNIKFDLKSELAIKNIFESPKYINEELNFFIKDKYIKMKTKITTEQYLENRFIFLLPSEINQCNIEIKANVLESNIRKEIEDTENLYKILNEIWDSIKNKKDISNIKQNFDLENILKRTINEISNVELLKKDFENFLGICADLIGVTDSNRKLKIIGENWTETFGWEKIELIETDLLNLIHYKHKEKFESVLKGIKFSKSKTEIIDTKVKCKDKTYKWIRWNLKFIREREMIGFTARDISKEKQQEDTTRKLENDIYLETIKNEFFANMSHEFKTPLNIILGTIQLFDVNIRKNNIVYNNEIDLYRYIKLLKQNSYRLLKLVNNLIDITKIDTGYYNLELGNYNIVNIVEDISLSVAQYALNKNINLIFDTSIEEAIIACDPEKIERILLNLLSNAIKYTKENGIIFVNLKNECDRIIISVCDNGYGISKEKLDDIFKRFVQGDAKLTGTQQGSGIGLSLVKSLVNMHEGEIKVESELGVGSKFEFYLPNKKINLNSEKKEKCIYADNKIEMCSIEFSDIYEI